MPKLNNVTKPKDLEQVNGYSNHSTWLVASTIQNNEPLYDLCKSLWEDGYKSFGAMLCKLREYGPTWKVNPLLTLNWNDDNIRSRELTAVLKDLYDKPKKKSKK